MIIFAKFTDKDNDDPIYINAALVRAVFTSDNGEGTVIEFDPDHAVVVAEYVDEVVKELSRLG